MDIVHCLDDRYAPMCATAIVSLCENNPNSDIQYHIISASLSQENKDALKEIINRYGAKVKFYDVDQTILKDCVIKEGDHVSLAAYLRILIPIILPDNIETVLYLDCDLVVCENISNLFSIQLTGFSCGAVYDGGTNDIRTYNRLIYDYEKGYFNSGVLLFNLKYWRENNITNNLFKFISEHPERLMFWDQDAINSVLAGKIKRLPFKYNMTDPFYQVNPTLRQEYLDEIEQSLLNPVILHFATANKPWYEDNPHPLKYKFYQYLSLTKWKNQYPIRASFKRRCLKAIEKYLNISVTRRKDNSLYRKLN